LSFMFRLLPLHFQVGAIGFALVDARAFAVGARVGQIAAAGVVLNVAAVGAFHQSHFTSPVVVIVRKTVQGKVCSNCMPLHS
jgi:hypothetical protein